MQKERTRKKRENLPLMKKRNLKKRRNKKEIATTTKDQEVEIKKSKKIINLERKRVDLIAIDLKDKKKVQTALLRIAANRISQMIQNKSKN